MAEEREFLHALNNRLAIAYGNAKILYKKLQAQTNPSQDLTDLVSRVEKIITSIESATQLIAERRLIVLNKDKAS